MMPALAPLAEVIGDGHLPDRQALETILLGVDLEGEAWAMEELKRWSKLLHRARRTSGARSKAAVMAALKGRGVPEASALLAVEIAAASGPAAGSEEAPGSGPPFSVEPPSLDFGCLKPGEGATATLRVSGGPGRAAVRSDRLNVMPSTFGPEHTELRVTLLGGSAGQLLWDGIRLQGERGEVEVLVTARWEAAASNPAPSVEAPSAPPAASSASQAEPSLVPLGASCVPVLSAGQPQLIQPTPLAGQSRWGALARLGPSFRPLEPILNFVLSKVAPNPDETQRILPWLAWQWQRLILLAAFPIGVIFYLLSFGSAAVLGWIAMALIAATAYSGIETGWLRATTRAPAAARVSGGVSIVVTASSAAVAGAVALFYMVLFILGLVIVVGLLALILRSLLRDSS